MAVLSDISVIILTKNEQLHIGRCLERIAALSPRQVFVVDCFSTDGTQRIVEEWKSRGVGDRQNDKTHCLISSADEFMRRALEKVDEWLADVSEGRFVAALDALLDEKLAAGEYRFKGADGRSAMRDGAIRFFREFSRKIVQLSDGRCVYFTPDERARRRNEDNAVSWAEYSVHAVTSSGKLLDGKDYRERLYNVHKAEGLGVLEGIIRDENCMYRLIDAHPENDAILFVGSDSDDARMEVVTRLDAFGNADANLAEVTVIATHRRKKGIPPSTIRRPLTEVVGTVAKHQAAGFSPSTTEDSIANAVAERKGGGIVLVEHEWPGLYAKQFNWALDNLPIEAKWVLRMDADEYLTPETIERLKIALTDGSFDDVNGLTLQLKRKFMGGEIRHGTNGIRLLRVWRYGKGRLEDRAMDEHVQVHGKVIDFDGAFYDDNLNTFEWWQNKHRGYAKREAQDAISLFNNSERLKNPSPTDRKKIKYYKLPPYCRAVAYFCIRYFFKLGFLDGYAGWMWHFWQGLWYRWIVDREIGRMKAGMQKEPLGVSGK